MLAVTSDSRFDLDVDPRLAEEAVLLAIRCASPEDQRLFRQARDPLYEISDSDLRERLFRELHGRWFTRLHLAENLQQAVHEVPSVLAGVSRCLVVPVVSTKEEYADLRQGWRDSLADAASGPTMIIRLCPTTLVDGDRLLRFLRRELLHIADMLDDEFGFDRNLQFAEGSAPLENLLRQRYRVLWDTTIDGRLAAKGLLPEAAEAARRSEFMATFSMLGASAGAWFKRFFAGPRPTHAELMAFAGKPGGDDTSQPGRCSLCQMPSELLPHPSSNLEPRVIAAIRSDFPGWRPESGLCAQCAELYTA